MKAASRVLTAFFGLTLFGSSALAQVVGPPTPPAEPLHPFAASFTVTNTPGAAGPQAGQDLDVTNLTLTNFDTSAQQVFSFAPILSGPNPKCGGPISGGTTPNLQVYLQPTQTLVIPYPTPLVFNRRKTNCIAAEVATVLHGGSVGVDVTGFLQAAKTQQ